MVSALTFCFIGLFFPLLCKSGFLHACTNRAVSRFSILFVERMTIFAIFFTLIDSTNRIRIFKCILFLSKQSQVIWTHAISVIANMIYNHTFWYGSMLRKISYAMCPPAFFTKIKLPITIFIQIVLPQLTFANLFPYFIESVEFLFGHVFHVTHYTPRYPLSNRFYA